MKTWPFKDPDEVVDYFYDWARNRLEEGETILSHEVVADEGSVVVDSSSEADGIVTVWLSGGTPDETNIVRCRIETSEGRTWDQSAKLKIKTR